MLIVGIISSIGLIIFASWLLLAVKRERALNAPLIGVVVCLILTLAGLSSSMSVGSTNIPAAANSPETVLGSLKISYQITETHNTANKTQILVSTKNVGNASFSGTVDIKSLNNDGFYLDMEVLHFFNLAPGQSRLSTCWLSLDQPPRLTLSSAGQ